MAGLRFCSRCNNLLEAYEEPNRKALMFRCKTCGANEISDTQLVYKNVLKKKAETRLEKIDPAVAFDPTLPRTFDANCAKCGGREAVFFQHQEGGRDADMVSALLFVVLIRKLTFFCLTTCLLGTHIFVCRVQTHVVKLVVNDMYKMFNIKMFLKFHSFSSRSNQLVKLGQGPLPVATNVSTKMGPLCFNKWTFIPYFFIFSKSINIFALHCIGSLDPIVVKVSGNSRKSLRAKGLHRKSWIQAKKKG